MRNVFKASIHKLTSLPLKDMLQLFEWPSTHKGNLQTENPNLLIAKATDGGGEAVAYLTAENILLVDGYTFNPRTSPEDSCRAGDVIDVALSQLPGANRIWITIPANCPPIDGERCVRIYERKVSQPVSKTAQQFQGCELRNQHDLSQFLN